MDELDLKAIIQSNTEISEKLEKVLVTLVARIEELEENIYYCKSGVSGLVEQVNRLEVWMHQEKGKREE